MKHIKDLFKDKDKKDMYKLGTVFLIGILLLLLSSNIGKSAKDTNDDNSIINLKDDNIIKSTETYSDSEKELELRLEEIFSLIEGAGKVKVMVTFNQGKETTVKQDTKTTYSSTDETDSGGGQRKLTDSTSEEKTVLVRNRDGSETPLVLVESEPKVEGIIIIAEGGNEITVKDGLTRAAQTVLGIDAHKVQVLKMKQN